MQIEFLRLNNLKAILQFEVYMMEFLKTEPMSYYMFTIILANNFITKILARKSCQYFFFIFLNNNKKGK